jgi:hypothetical protein
MGKRFFVTELEKDTIRNLYEQVAGVAFGGEMNGFKKPKEEKGGKLFCNAKNTKNIHDLMGGADPETYIDGIQLRKGGVNGLVDKLEVLKTMRLFPQITDGGSDLSSQIATDLQEFKPYNYFDENSKECCRAMDKIIELYKENEHGEELVKDIEKIYGLSYLDARAKEFLKHSLGVIKGE